MRRYFPVVVLLCLAAPAFAQGPQSRAEIEAFMRSAKVVAHKDTSSGVTHPTRLTLSDGTYKHDAVFQPIDQHMNTFTPDRGKTELNFVDSWRYNIAADHLGQMLGLASMMAPTIEYHYDAKAGALSWWMDSLMNEGERLKKKIQPRDPNAWNNDMYRQRMFTDLVEDTDRNLTNVLVSPDWRVIMIDFTRAFRLGTTIRPLELTKGDRALLAKMETLTLENVSAATKDYLGKREIEALLVRRDLIIAHYKDLVAKVGEARVLF